MQWSENAITNEMEQWMNETAPRMKQKVPHLWETMLILFKINI